MDPAEIAQRFQFHPRDADNQEPPHDTLRQLACEYGHALNELLPDGREKSTALTKLEESVFWADAGLDRADGPKT